ncbi:MAG: DNA repair putative endonuclease MmcB [Alphaproteobacteria bacterium]|nr:DNA repair putative endonuclease MmcB [Alphaproteobacteria bacterium]
MDCAAASRPDVTAALARGVQRLLLDHGFAPVLELPLGNGRRADVVGLGPKGEIWIVETKSCLADFSADGKWPDYLDYCDAFYFAVDEQFPQSALPAEPGLIVADQFGGAIVRAAPVAPLAGARRKAMMLAFARLAATRMALTSIG